MTDNANKKLSKQVRWKTLLCTLVFLSLLNNFLLTQVCPHGCMERNYFIHNLSQEELPPPFQLSFEATTQRELQCTERVAIYLKCTKGQRLFYARHGFKMVRKEHIPSPNLFAVVPKSNAAAQPPHTFLVCMAQTTPEVTVPNLSEAASVLAHLKDPPPSPPEATDSDTKRPPGDRNPPDDVAKRRSSRKLRAQQQAFDRVTVIRPCYPTCSQWFLRPSSWY
jgi:hypothetical protein